jgi:2-desacetyl-2-hydroxyethyl bacteriochlorophyllide A dehydrogenase
MKRVRHAETVVFSDLEAADVDSILVTGPSADEVLVQVDYSAVSIGTELSVFTGAVKKAFPYFPGYSGSGTVIACGSRVEGLKPGDLVAGQFKNARICRVSSSKVFLIPKGVDPREAAFIELGIICQQAVRKAGSLGGCPTTVVGCGIIGCMTLALCRAAGAGPLHAVATSDSRAHIARLAGADHFWQRGDPRTPGSNITFEASGAAGALSACVSITNPGGKIVVLGSARTAEHGLDMHRIASERIELIGAHVGVLADRESSSDFWTYREEGLAFLDLLQTRRLPILSLITHTVPVEANRINSFYEALGASQMKPVGALLCWKISHSAHNVVPLSRLSASDSQSI